MVDRRMQVFHTVAGVLSFTRAAELLHMTQPAITHQIRRLEEELDTRLFDRTNNRINLTAAGLEVQRYAARIVDLHEQMAESVNAMTGVHTGLVTLGASTTIGEYMLPGLLGDFRQSFPEVQVRLTVANTEAVVAMVADNVIDLGIVEGDVANQSLRVESCVSDELVVVAPPEHPFAARTDIEPQDLLEHEFIQREIGSGTRSVIARWLLSVGLDEDRLHSAVELGSTEAIKGAVQAGLGVSIVSRATIGKEVMLGTLVAKPLKPRLPRSFYFVRQRQKFRSHLMDELFDFARQHLDQGVAGERQ
jgi:DNA-binding transcriptional LysR family regulator